MNGQALRDLMTSRRTPRHGSGPLSRACLDAACGDCSLKDCTCAHHYPQCPHCGSRSVQLTWVSMAAWDSDGWTCHTCGRGWSVRPATA